MARGWHEYATGELVETADINDKFVNQGVMFFADATARDAAITTPEEGMHTYLADSNTITFYDGAAWSTLLGGVTSAGDIAYFDGTSWQRLAKGTTGQMLQQDTSAPVWASVSSNPTFEAATVATSESTSSTSYTDLATSGPSVTLTPPASGNVLVLVGMLSHNSGNAGQVFMSVDLSSGNTLAAADTRALSHSGSSEWFEASNAFVLTGLTASSTVFTAKYRTVTGTPTFANRRLTVVPLG